MVDYAYSLTISSSEKPKKLKGLRFRKQVLYVDKFVKVDIKGGSSQHIPINEKFIDDVYASTKRLIKNGVKVFVPKEHTDDPEENRGYVLSVEKGLDSKKRVSLFAVVEFRDKTAAKMALSSDMSAYIPPVFYDGKGRQYYRPMIHLALTVQPVIPDLMGFETIAASLNFGGPKKMSKKLRKLAEDLDIELEDGEELTAQMIADHYEFSLGGEDDDDDDDDDDDFDDDLDDDGDGDDEVNETTLSLLKENRIAKIEKLANISDPKITPAVAKKLKKTWCTRKALTLSMNDKNHMQMFNDTIESLSMNDGIRVNDDDSSGPQTISLSKEDVFDEKKNPLLADAASRCSG